MIKFSLEEIEKAIKAVEIKVRVNRELALESTNANHRMDYERQAVEYATRLEELKILKEEHNATQN